ncbi:hypothetical protein CBR_g34879 [Chara braunii]|uniref:Retrotransposon gag domain-containing protein n=1 Tax=Chara braunii TaxID=69332 RepID=A0A388LJW2_CHABU|nr:hypothetical protein CBR_g34879 [Chara braunii]|eukprot:GBG82502.1 hypothetical protein CBR_g34879 [Chara braunii]
MNANVQNPNLQQNANQPNPNQTAPRAWAPMTPPDLYLSDPAHHLAGAWLATLRAQQYDDNEAQVNIPARLGEDAHDWFSTYVWVDLLTFEQDFLNRFDYVHPEQALYMIKDRVQKPLESVAEYRNRFYRMFVKTERGEQVGRDLFIDGLRSRTIRAKLRNQFPPINHTLQQIMAAAEEIERKFTANFLEGEDYSREGDSTELARARAELAALQNKFENMGFVSGPVTYLEQVGPIRPTPSEIPSVPVPVMPTPVRTAPPPPIENPVRTNESTAIFELTKTLISLIQESKKEQREHNARLEAMMRNMRPIAVRAHPIEQGLVQAPVLGGAASNLNWRHWREHFVELSVCLVGVRVTWTRHGDHRQRTEYLELLIIQVWRTEVAGDLLGFLFGSVRPDHRQLIVQELTVPLAQLADDLPLEIVLQSDDSAVPHVLTRTLAPYLKWSACLEEPGSGRNPPSQRGHLDPHEIVDLAFFQDRTASEDEEVQIEAEEESLEEEEEVKEVADEEETPEEGSYSEHNEGEQSEAEEEEEQDDDEEEEDQEESEESEYKGFEEEVRDEARAQAQAQKREEIAARKRQLEIASAAGEPRTDDPARDPEPPKPEDGETAAETSAAPARRRRSRSPSPSTADRPPARPGTDAGHRASPPVVIPPSP